MATKYNLNKFNLYNNLILNKMQIPNKIKPQNSFNRLRKSPTVYQFLFILRTLATLNYFLVSVNV